MRYLMGALLWLLSAWMGLAVAAPKTCSRPLRISADQAIAEIANTEEAWFLRFLQAQKCSYLWIGTDISTQRRMQMMASGELDVALSATFTPERDRFAFFSAPYRQEVFYLLVRKGSEPLPTIDDYLDNKYFLILPRYGVYPETINDLRRRFSAQNLLNEYKDASQGVALLNRNPQSVLLILDGSYEPLRQQQTQITMLPWRLFGNPLHIMFSRVSTQPADVDLFNEWLKQNPFTGMP